MAANTCVYVSKKRVNVFPFSLNIHCEKIADIRADHRDTKLFTFLEPVENDKVAIDYMLGSPSNHLNFLLK